MTPKNSNNNSFLQFIMSRIDSLNNWLKVLPGIIGFVFLVLKNYKQNPIKIYIGVSLIIISIFLFVIKWRMSRNTSRTIKQQENYTAKKSYIRGLLPFEKVDEKLLGRDREQKMIRTIITNRTFKFGYISGEAGSGKTSFIRNIILNDSEECGLIAIYITTNQNDLINSITEEIAKYFNITNKNITFNQLIKKIENKSTNPILLILDQFEIFFISIKSQYERKVIINNLVNFLNIPQLKFSILVSIRKEFVDDLREFSPNLDQPINVHYSLRIGSWDKQLAKSVIEQIVSNDELGFSKELTNTVIDDLSIDGSVKPVELQIVLKSLIDERITNLYKYRLQGDATGILASYIKNIIEPKEIQQTELEKIVLKIILRSLCEERADTKKIKGLTYSQIQDVVMKTINKYFPSLFPGVANLNEMVFVQVNKLITSYIIKFEDQESINLIHDYIVLPIKLATADVQTTEVIANNILLKYFEELKTSPKISLTYKHYKFIKLYSSNDFRHKSEYITLIKNTKKRITITSIIVITAFLLLLTILFPPKMKTSNYPILSSDVIQWTKGFESKIVIAQLKDSTYVYENINQLRLLQTLPAYTDIKISRDCNWIFATDNSKSYLFKKGLNLYEINCIFPTVPSSQIMPIFSIKDNYLQFIGVNQSLYIVDLNQNPITPKPLIENITTKNPTKNRSNEPYVMESPNGKYFVGIIFKDQEMEYFILRKEDVSSSQSFIKYFKIPGYNFNWQQNGFVISPNDSLLVYRYDSKLAVINVDSLYLNRNYTNVYIDLQVDFSYGTSVFSPDNNWLFIKNYGTNDLGIFLKNNYIVKLDSITVEKEYSLGSYWGKSNFSDNGEYFFFSDVIGNLYLQNLFEINILSFPCEIFIANDDINETHHMTPKVSFSPSGNNMLICTPSGYVYTAPVGIKPDLELPIANFGDNTRFIRNYWGSEGEYLYLFANNIIKYGAVNKDLKQLQIDLNLEINDIIISKDNKSLIILSKSELQSVQCKLYLWNIIPIKTFKWPKLEYNNL